MIKTRLLAFSCLFASILQISSASFSFADNPWRYLKGVSEASSPDAAAWRAVDFDDGPWLAGLVPFSFGRISTGTELSDMKDKYTSIFLRKSFTLTNLADITDLTLGAVIDDGFIAWLNGVEVARFNVPLGVVPFNGTALTSLSDPLQPLTFKVADPASILVPGENVLAVQAFNSALGNADFQAGFTLIGELDQAAPVITEITPPEQTRLPNLNYLEIQFSEPVRGLDAADLLINGRPATNVVGYLPGQYVFEFDQPAAGLVQVSWAAGHGITDASSRSNAFAGKDWTYTLDPAAISGVVISEFMASNTKTIRDDDKDYSDWIELFNPGSSPVNLEGWYLTDDATNLTQWRFPAVTMATNSYLLVWASAKNKSTNLARLHTNFRLGAKGNYLALVDPNGKVVSDFGAKYPAQTDDISYGRLPGDLSATGYFSKPTPGAPNFIGGSGFAPPVDFSRPSSTFARPFTLALSSFGTNVIIRYTITTNGTQALTNVPTTSSSLYTGPFLITNTVHVRARAFLPGLLPGPVQSETYFELSTNILNFNSDLPIVVFHNFGGRAVSATINKFMVMQVFDRRNGRSSLTNAPDISTRGIFRLRGSSTEGYSKGSYAVETEDEYNNDKDIAPLGMPAESDWVFYAPNNFEPVLIHNPFAYELSRQMGRYATRTRFVEVFLNINGGPLLTNNYNGIYSFEEKIKRGKDRVDIDALLPEDTVEPDVSGGYMLKIDRTDPAEAPFSAAGQSINYVDPKWVEITSPQRLPQKTYIAKFFNDFGASLRIRNYTNAPAPYDKFIDVPSWIDHHVHNVLTFNVDALRLSGYFYKPRNGKITMGPVWDFDRTLNSTDGRDLNPVVWRSTAGDQGTDFFNYPWWTDLFKDPNFWQKWIDRWQELRPNVLSTNNLNAIVDIYANEVRQAQPREYAKWRVQGRYAPVGVLRATNYQGEVDAMKDWLRRRSDFIDRQFIDSPKFLIGQEKIAAGTAVKVKFGASLFMTGSPIKTNGVLYYTLDGSDPRAFGGGLNSNALVYSSAAAPVVLTKNTRVTARMRDLTHKNLTGANNPPISSPWSGPTAVTFFLGTPSLIISEIMYHPSAASSDASDSAENYEFIELKNTGTTPLDLNGFTISGNADFSFTGSSVTTLAPGAYVLIVKDRKAFESRYGILPNVAGQYIGTLDNAGGRLLLAGPAREPILDFRYENQWYPITDGEGFSLTVANETAPPLPGWGNKANWRVSTTILGSPGKADGAAPAIPAIFINEVVANTVPPKLDTVELFNPGAAGADISGWFLTDDPNQPKKFRFPAGSLVPATGYLVVDEKSFNTGANGFALSALGDEIYLYSGDASTNLTGYRHGFTFGASEEGVSFGRHLTTEGEERFSAQITNTFNAANSGPRIGPIVINEILPNPAPRVEPYNNTPDEFIELKNISNLAVDLFDTAIVTNTWHLRGGVQFEFSPGFRLAAGGYVIVVGFDPELETGLAESVRAKFNIPPAVPLVGPYRGVLNNSGDRLILNKPLAPVVRTPGEEPEIPRVVMDEVDYSFISRGANHQDEPGPSVQRFPSNAYGDDAGHWQAALPTPGRDNTGQSLADSDGDGLPDDWERAHGLDPNSTAGVNGPAGDPDQDGVSNLQEFISGTDPKNPGSFLRVTSIANVSGSTVLQFTAKAGKAYTVLYRTDSVSSPWSKLITVPASGFDHSVEVTDPIPVSAKMRIYRLVTPPLP